MFIFIGNLRNQAGKTNNGRYYKNSKKIKKNMKKLTGEQTEKNRKTQFRSIRTKISMLKQQIECKKTKSPNSKSCAQSQVSTLYTTRIPTTVQPKRSK